MGTINSNDVMFATVTRRGTTVFSGRILGVASMAELISRLRDILKGAAGQFTLTLRNGSQGWSRSTSLVLAPVEGTQLTLF